MSGGGGVGGDGGGVVVVVDLLFYVPCGGISPLKTSLSRSNVVKTKFKKNVFLFLLSGADDDGYDV